MEAEGGQEFPRRMVCVLHSGQNEKGGGQAGSRHGLGKGIRCHGLGKGSARARPVGGHRQQVCAPSMEVDSDRWEGWKDTLGPSLKGFAGPAEGLAVYPKAVRKLQKHLWVISLSTDGFMRAP